MAAKPVEIHPAALAEFKIALKWYRERSETAAFRLVGELDRAINLAGEAPGRWPKESGSKAFIVIRWTNAPSAA